MTTVSKSTDENATHKAICVFCGQEVDPDREWRPANVPPGHCENCGQSRAKRPKAPTPQSDSPAIDTESFWSSSRQLTDLRQFARARMVGPWAMLGNALALVTCSIPPHVVLPPTIGSYASLNLFVALVGRSGDSKSASMAAAAEWLRIEPDYPASKPGSGEGLAKCFAYMAKLPANQGGGFEQRGKQWSVLAKIPEVDTLTATAARGGATIMSTLREGWSGERLGSDYAGEEKRILLQQDRYRLCLVIGVQPGRARALFDEAEAGTPQRIVWLPSADPDAPDDEPPEPATLNLGRWESHPQSPAPKGAIIDADTNRNRQLSEKADPTKFDVLLIPDTATELIKATRRAVRRGDESVDPLDSHKLLARLKVAAALMVLENRRNRVTESDWERAGMIIAISDETRSKVLAELSHRSSEENASKGYAAGIRDDIAEQTKLDRAESRVAENIMRLLRDKFPGYGQRSAVRVKIAARDRDYFDGAESKLIDTFRIEKLPAASGTGGSGGVDGFILRLKDSRA